MDGVDNRIGNIRWEGNIRLYGDWYLKASKDSQASLTIMFEV